MTNQQLPFPISIGNGRNSLPKTLKTDIHTTALLVVTRDDKFAGQRQINCAGARLSFNKMQVIARRDGVSFGMTEGVSMFAPPSTPESLKLAAVYRDLCSFHAAEG